MDGPSKLAWSFSCLLHGGLILMLLFGPSLRPTPRPAPPSGIMMEAVVIDSASLALAKFEPLPAPPDPVDMKKELERVTKEREQQAVLEEQRRQKEIEDKNRLQKEKEEAEKLAAEQERQKKLRLQKEADDKRNKEAEEKLALDKVEQEKIAQQKRQKEEAERVAEEKRKKEEADRLAEDKRKKEEAERKAAKKKEEERKRKEALAAQLKAEQDAREKELMAALGAEEQRTAAVDSGLLAQYQAQVIAKVTRNWNRPPSAVEGLKCTVRAAQIPGGEVVSVEVMECNGDEAVKRSIESAVYKASPLPEPPDPTLFERNLIFIFAPK